MGLSAPAANLTVSNSVIGTTPSSLGYNLGHFMAGSNAADWFRYSGADAARIFISVADIEPTDDLPPTGDGVSTESGFFARRNLLRANASSPGEPLNPAYVNWATFTANQAITTSGSNKIRLDVALTYFRQRGIAVLANLTATPSRFPIAGDTDWPGKWELWQHYYAHAWLLARDYGVQRFSMFNEPNGWDGMTEADWLRRQRICSDAIQCALQDVNARHGTAFKASVFSPNTANGAEKYNTAGADEASTDTWGHDVVSSRHLRLDGTVSPDWMNLHVYNYQKYTTRTHAAGGLSGYVTDFDQLRALINADMPGEPLVPMALTEFNVRTGANYDLTTATQDSPADFAALGANCIALTERGISQLYLFKFAQTASASTYGVAKNGTHYVQNTTGGNHNYGGATQCAEVYRLFIKASRGARPRLAVMAGMGAAPTTTGGLWSQATRDPATGTYHLFLTNKESTTLPLDLDFHSLGLPGTQPWFVEEVSAGSHGGITGHGTLTDGRLTGTVMPAQSVQLLTLPGGAEDMTSQVASEDCNPADGAGKNLTSPTFPQLTVRSDGTVDSRRVALLKLPLPPGPPAARRAVLLKMIVGTTAGSVPVQAHVYGITFPNWTEASATWANAADILKQNVPAGNRIENNTIQSQGTALTFLGQITAETTMPKPHALDVTEFVNSCQDGVASFLIIQDHRWDIAQPSLATGDTQPAGLVIGSHRTPGAGAELITMPAPPPWPRWRREKFPDSPEDDAISGPTADPDGDGLVNLLEYALGGEPAGAMAPDTGLLPTVSKSGTGILFALTRNPGQYDLRLVVESAPNPAGPWSTRAEATDGMAFAAKDAGITISGDKPDPGRITVSCALSSPPDAARHFVRMRVELKTEF